MDSNEKTIETKSPVSVGWRLFSFFSKVDTQIIALILLILLALQAFFGLFESTPSQAELVALYFGKTVVIRLIGFLGLVNGAIDLYCRAFVHRKKAFKWTFLKRPWTGFFAVLLFWSLFAILPAADKKLAIFGGAYRYEGFLSFLAYAGIFVNAALIKSDKYRKIIFAVVTATSTLLAGFAMLKDIAGASFLMSRSGQVNRFSATFINSNHYGYYLCVSMIVIAGLFMTSKKWWWKLITGACFAVNLIVLLYNSTLGAYLALALGLIVFFVFYIIRKGIVKALPILILIALFIGLSFVINNHRVLNDLKLLTTQTGDLVSIIDSGVADTEEGQQAINKIGSGRGRLWKKTIKVMLDNPLIGVGTDNIQLYIDYQIPHNEYLQVGANLGFPGLAFYLAALISCFAYAMKNLRKMSDGALVAGMATLVYCVSAFTGISIPVATYQLFMYMGILTGWFKCRDDEKMNEQAMEEMKKKREELAAMKAKAEAENEADGVTSDESVTVAEAGEAKAPQ